MMLKRFTLILTILSFTLLSGCATTGAVDQRDPIEGLNRAIYKFNDGVDRAIASVKQVAARGVVRRRPALYQFADLSRREIDRGDGRIVPTFDGRGADDEQDRVAVGERRRKPMRFLTFTQFGQRLVGSACCVDDVQPVGIAAGEDDSVVR